MRALLLMLLMAPLAWAELRIEGPDKVQANRIVRLKASGAADGAAYIWDVSDEDKVDAEESGGRLLFAAPPGVYRIKLRAVSLKDGKTTVETARFSVTVGPTLPDPKPLPDDPPPPKPTPADGPLRVLIVYESADLAKLPATQQTVVYGKAVRDWLNANCAQDGAVKAWRMWDKDVDAGEEASHWQAMIKRPRSALPFIHVMRGDTPAYEGPLPSTPTEAIALLSKYAGGK